MVDPVRVSVVVIAYQKPYPLLCSVYSVLSQEYPYWDLLVLHDGEAPRSITYPMGIIVANHPNVRFEEVIPRTGGCGNALRDRAIDMVTGDYIAMTNDDNYYTPVFLEKMVGASEGGTAAVVHCDCIHNYFLPPIAVTPQAPQAKDWKGYAYFSTSPVSTGVDLCCAMVRRDVASKIRYRNVGACSDGVYVEAAVRSGGPVKKVVGALVVHN